MMSKAEQIRSREWEVGTIIKLVSNMNIEAVCKIAKRLNKLYDTEEKLDKLENSMIYEQYCKEGEK